MTVPTPGHHPRPGCLPTCRLRSGREELDGETSAALGPATGDNFSPILGAHALPKSMLSLALEIRGLSKGERHHTLLYLLDRSIGRVALYGLGGKGVNVITLVLLALEPIHSGFR